MKRTIEIVRRIPTLRAVPILCLLAAMAFAPSAKAAFVTGEFAPGSTSVRVTPTEILFYNLGLPPLTPPTGSFNVLTPVSGSFVTGTGNTILDLTRTPGDPSCVGCGFAPTDTVLAINNFMQLPNGGNAITIQLTGISAAIDTPGTPLCGSLTALQLSAAGTTCTPDSTSPFLLKNVANGGSISTTVSFNGSGLAWFLSSSSDKSIASIAFGTSFTSTTIGQLLTTLATQGFVESSLQGDVKVSAVPEPGTLSLAGLALIGLGLLKRRKARS